MKGRLKAAEDGHLLLEVAGVGYEVFVGVVDPYMPRLGAACELWIHTHVREDQLALFGFADAAAKKIFLLLLGVSGVGPKLAMAVVATLSARELFDAVHLGNLKALTAVPGVGKKVAERLTLELKDKMMPVMQQGGALQAGLPQEGREWHDLMDALSGLGFSDQKIRNVLKLARAEFAGQSVEINQLLKYSLQKIKQC
nr:Holliday junction branch migration protein RuvA [Acanthopleuribacter pedis]